MKYIPLALAFSLPVLAQAADTTDTANLNKQTVTADFRQTDVQQLAEATTVVGAEQIEARSAEHLEQILSFAPNVNFSSGSSRARFYQIRGVGDRSQFIDPVNPSVGLVIDGIDMTGLGAAATLFDVQQVEVLRGPQGTRFGANALGGMINITSTDPSQETQGYVSAKAGNYNAGGLGAAVSGSLGKDVQGRIAVHHFQSDGYTKNTYLDRKDTQDQNETLVRTKLAWQPTADSNVKLTYLYANIDNGYDAFTLDNSRHSLADEPGKDKQETHAWALSYTNVLNNKVSFESVISGSHNDATYSFDEDWVNPDYGELWGKAFDEYSRTYKYGSVDLRFISGVDGRLFNDSTDWVIGLYDMTRDINLERLYNSDPYSNDLAIKSASVYGELITQLNPNARLIYGARIENWKNDFSASDNVFVKTDDWLVGGKITYEQLLNYDHLGYLSYANGYKPSGANSKNSIPEEYRKFDVERNHTFETGLKSSWLDEELQTRLAVFYIIRKDQQVKSSYPVPNSPKFKDYLANAAEGRNYGLEFESRWQLTQSLMWDLSYGYLHTKFHDYTYETDDGWVTKTGRAQSHAPKHSAATAFTYRILEPLALRLEAEAKDTFYFSDSHDEMASGYVLYHARLSFDKPRYELALSGRNLTNVDTETRGYRFENDIQTPNVKHKYVQLGEPRLVMLEGKFKF